MNQYPTVVTVPFADGARDVPEHLASLFKAHRIPTFQLTYDDAVERLNWVNAEKHVRRVFDDIQNAHLREFGR